MMQFGIQDSEFEMFSDDYFMRAALREAQAAFEKGEIPIGALITSGEKILARGHNMTEQLKDVTAHAEMIALTAAFNKLSAKYLTDCTLYVTVEPCLMCAGALYWSRIARVVYGAEDVKNGYRKTTGRSNPFHPKTSLIKGVLGDECAALMKDFFAARR